MEHRIINQNTPMLEKVGRILRKYNGENGSNSTSMDRFRSMVAEVDPPSNKYFIHHFFILARLAIDQE